MSKYLQPTLVGGEEPTFERLDTGVRDYQRRILEDRKMKALHEKRATKRMQEHLDRLEARRIGKLAKTKETEKTFTGISAKQAEALRGSVSAVKAFLSSKEDPTIALKYLKGAQVAMDLDGTSKGDKLVDKIQNMDPGSSSRTSTPTSRSWSRSGRKGSPFPRKGSTTTPRTASRSPASRPSSPTRTPTTSGPTASAPTAPSSN